MESILDECRTARLPERRLTWHYRSQNESLIAFSNHRYYDGDLITFPAPVTVDSAVSLRRIDGVWSRGKDRTNQAEAEAIVAEVVKRLRSADAMGTNTPSIAVITLNAEQQDLINDLLDKERRRYPEVEAAFSIELAEPIIVKNLETVQGDERDVVLLGIGYGPDTLGAPDMKMNFGPLNRAGGARRLNVAITRARAEMIVFCSFPPGFIDTARTTAEAVRDLKDFLSFAERGRRALNETVGGSLGGYDSPFEQAVARALRDRGWSVNTQIGVSRFRIDLGIVHPDFPGDYVAGVECDGASYHSSASARDRDKVREEILRARGWHIERVWSTDWWIDAASVLDRLHATLERRLEADRARRSKDAERLRANAETATLTTASKTIAETTPGGYRYATFESFRESVAPDAFDEARYTPQLERMIAHVMEIEAPIRLSELIERIARAHGFRRSGTRIAERLTALIRQSYYIEVEDNEHVFAWKNQGDEHNDIKPRYPATSEDVRQIDDISLRELASAMIDAPTDDALTDVARKFGVRRLTANARDRLRKASELRRAL
jgi:very-short-patch-repair endonuclease